ncbi:(2Fe-2S)-binding protein [Mangrovimicrobium sediminis]|uniref:(2Fe-2S)-binding protein n=1 Tax=Mangrovimicrobium sediminis TaxID=2562682 RepID=A0A4Z0M2N0_9GAMM|nr:2Fe-2S iron-sulfur cluster-binding protein [Haliea sp. SAOS-164]TGD73545.1 (2Fe-2S)-binding protein [Haliea sp. SAOS-164]
MADITFSSPNYKNKTVYAVAGSHTETVLQIAKEFKIPIGFNCQDGECGTCLVKVTSLETKERMAGPLTDKERTVLLELGKLSKDQVDKMLVDDFPCEWRLACQMIVRDEDLLVEYDVE